MEMGEQRVREIVKEEMKTKKATAVTVTSNVKINISEKVDVQKLSELLLTSLTANSNNLIGK